MSVTVLRASSAAQAGAAGVEAHRRSLLALWHLLSLDAPSIAALWTWFIARSCGVPLSFASVAAMLLAVWILYIADRLLDARALPRHTDAFADQGGSASDGLEARHRFHARHRGAFLFTALVAAVGLAATLTLIPASALRLYAVLGSLLAIYFLCIHVLKAGRRLPKELAVGVFFSAAVFIPTVAARPDLRLHLVPLALLFSALCSTNCLRIYAWEHPDFARDHAPATGATIVTDEHATDLHPLTRVALSHLDLIHAALTAIALALACFRHSAVAGAIALSGLALFALQPVHLRLCRVDLRAAADLVLAAPLPLALLLRLLR